MSHLWKEIEETLKGNGVDYEHFLIKENVLPLISCPKRSVKVTGVSWLSAVTVL